MLSSLRNLYFNLTLKHPYLVLVVTLVFIAVSAYYAQQFKLDASADALVLENDKDLNYYRAIRARYGSDDFLFITYTPKAPMMSDATLADLRVLRDELASLERVESVVTMLDVPLIDSPRVTLGELRREIRTLETPGVDRQLALRELTTSRLYKNLLMSPDGKTTTLQVNFKWDRRYVELREARDALRAKALEAPLSDGEKRELERVSKVFDAYKAAAQDQLQADIAAVRGILARHKENAEIHLGGVPMVASDMIDYVRNDIRVFGVGVAVFLLVLLSVSFKRPRWVVLPMFICAVAGIGMVGYLGLVDWRVTVVSSNFISLMLILSLSLVVHLIVRYEELHEERNTLGHAGKIEETIRSKFAPSLFTALTTMVAFASLIFSGIRPVMDFGWMMVIGVGMALVLTFLLFPAGLAPLKPSPPVFRRIDLTALITRRLATVIHRYGKATIAVYVVVVVVGLVGISRLTVENSFIDYFKKSTEIYQGMVLIDRKVGGTTPLDVILDPPAEFFASAARAEREPSGKDDEFDALFEDEESDGGAGITGSSYWFNVFQLETIKAVHAYLESQPELGKVLSMDTTMDLLQKLNQDKPIDNLTLSVMYKRMPESIKKTLFDPYMSADGNQMRFAIRVIDSNPDLQRDELIKRIRSDLVARFGLEPGQVHLTGMLVLYNNVLQSLFRSQILTLTAVFVAIMLMFAMLFRSVRIAAIGIVPTLVAASLILGLMGLVGIPLDIMTITIAAITIGIGVDDTIHYTHRIREEFGLRGNYWEAVHASHASVGRAVYYTSVIITLGFSILVLSNFIPTIYFGVLTGLAMVVALVANLTLLPLLIQKFKPFGPEVAPEPARP
ncbi:MAG: RND family transporter [Gammaproteobacteria bacterium]